MKGMKKLRGFTLIELMITLAVMAILITAALPSFNEFIKNNRLTTQANDFIAAMNLARSEAIKRGASINISSTSGDGNWSGGWRITDTGGNIIRITQALTGNSTLTSTNGVAQFQYRADGLINTPDTLSLCDDRGGETGRTITINTVGRASVTTLNCP
jgi:type IV fimbrial biogenesis protein FimT